MLEKEHMQFMVFPCYNNISLCIFNIIYRRDFMLKYLKKYWFFALLAPLFMLGEVSMDLLQPQLMSTIVDEGVLGLSNNNVGDLSLVIRTGLQMIGLVLIGCLCGILSGVFANLCSQNFSNDLRKDTFSKIEVVPYSSDRALIEIAIIFFPHSKFGLGFDCHP